jgi:predicted patatin/cPLA2 family phospholipase
MPVGLVLEGGGMRGWYTSGVLTAFKEEHIQFPAVYGVSAGALNALAYISGQLNQHSATSYMKHMKDKRYMSVGNLRRTGSFFGFDFMLEELPHQIPFDYGTFFNSSIGLQVGTTNLQTGKAVYFNKSDMDESFTAVKASCSLPFISNIVEYHDYPLLDGGCSEPIPIERSLRDGNERNVIVLTQEAAFREKQGPNFSHSVLKIKYGRYPNFVHSFEQHFQIYNHEIALCNRLEQEGKAVIVRPHNHISFGRHYRETVQLLPIYNMWVSDGREKLPVIQKLFLGINESCPSQNIFSENTSAS